MPAQAGRWGRFSEHQARQLQRQVQAKEERIVELEMENAVLHLRLAQCRGMTGEAGSAAAGLCPRCLEQDPPRRSTPPAAPQLHRRVQVGVQKLKQDIKALRASSLAAFRACWEHLQDGLSAVEAAVQGAQLCHQALLAWQSKVGQLERSLQEADARYQLEKQKRRVLHNRLVELKGNIRVHCRIRPLLPFDKEFGDPASQDRVYGPEESQQVVFGDVCPLLTSLIDGYNVCIMAYGQTGCGKSYTMLGPHSKEERIPPWGPHSDLGIMPRAAAELFRLIAENPSRRLQVDLSIVEVYNNNIFDLLAKARGMAASGCRREALTTKDARREVPLLTREPVHSAEDFVALAARSLRLRAELATLVHARSSRSHLIITATLTRGPAAGGSPADQQAERPPLEGRPASGSRGGASCGRAPAGSPGAQQPKEQVHAKLQLVDLAGSECAGVSGVTGSALRETSFINRSLAALADVLGALSERRGHIPYRNSQLTHFLQDVLGGDAKLLVMLCVSPCRKHVAETLRCLGFGARARQVQRGQASGGSPAPRKPR
ncbi:kinesin-like protein KIF25 isoform X3 [Canis lupus familiaris]|uniref:kinesin-like protein KIF25 isoform X3 n=1 Tax=Canis lupus familiaris TaxID=9615 RepID=UPI0018F5F9D9|nr:kinesin-like protein KIF25 isoform X3 [Canis lupus familiaris]XP_038510592.1 kinesin-like protein KIF25 isoform X3 [Canis lupus familiaris]